MQVEIQEMKYNNYITLFGLIFVIAVVQPANGQGVIVKKGEKIKSDGQSGNVGPVNIRVAKGKSQLIELLNGDKLTGEMKSFSEETGIRWIHPAALESIGFRPSGVARIRLNYEPPALPNRKISVIRFLNGDEVSGEINVLTSKLLRLSSNYAGELTIPRDEIVSISSTKSATAAIYEGPNGIKGWAGSGMKNLDGMNFKQRVPLKNDGTGGWRYWGNSFYTASGSAQIGRKVKYPDRVSVEFDLAWRGYFQVAVHLFAEKQEQHTGNAYILRVNQSSASLHRMAANGAQTSLSSVSLQQLRSKAKARFTILANRKTRAMTLLVDGEQKKQWNDTQQFIGGGDGLLFVSQGSASVKLNKIKISEWDGKIPAAGEASSGRTKDDVLRLVDNDRMTGKLVSVQDQKVIFVPTIIGEEYAVPIEKVAIIELAGAAPVTPIEPLEGDIQAHFINGGSVTFKLQGWGLGEVSGESEILGNVTFRPDAFSRIEFNLDKERPGEADPFGF